MDENFDREKIVDCMFDPITPGERRRGSPTCGQDTESVLSELGYSADQIAELESAGAVASFSEQDLT